MIFLYHGTSRRYPVVFNGLLNTDDSDYVRISVVTILHILNNAKKVHLVYITRMQI